MSENENRPEGTIPPRKKRMLARTVIRYVLVALLAFVSLAILIVAVIDVLGIWPANADFVLAGTASIPAHHHPAWATRATAYALALIMIGVGIMQYAIIEKSRMRRSASDMPDTEERRDKRERREWKATFAHELSMAFVIAGLVVVTFELSLREHEQAESEHRQQEIQKDVVRHLLGYGIDSAVMDEVHQGVFAARLVRENLNIDYQLRNGDEKKDSLRLRTEVSYRLRNMGNDDLKYELRESFINMCQCEGEKDGFTHLEVWHPNDNSKPVLRITQDIINSIAYKSAPSQEKAGADAIQTANLTLPGEKRDIATLAFDGIRKSIYVKDPIVVPAGQYVEIHFAYEENRRFRDMVTYITPHPAKDLSVTATLCDQSVKHLRLHIGSAHRLEPIKDSIDDKTNMQARWHIRSAVLPGQGIELFWHPTLVTTPTIGNKADAPAGAKSLPR